MICQNQINNIISFFRESDRPSLIFGILMVWNLFGFLPSIPQVLIYIILTFYAYQNIKTITHVNYTYLLFLVYVPIQLAITSPPEIFNSWVRYLILLLVLLSLSPFLRSQIIEERHLTVFKILMYASLLVGVSSFFCRFLGVNFMRSTINDFINHAGAFGGITRHSMLLGPFAGLGVIYSSYKAITSKNRYYWACALFCMGSVLFSASRSSLFATIAGLCILLLRVVDFRRSIKIVLSIIFLLGISYPLWSSALDGVIKKNLNNTEALDTSSRKGKWDARLSEFDKDPIFGIGFATVDLQYTEDYDKSNGGVEPGSSWLSVLSMTGIVGFAMIFTMFFKGILNVWRAHTQKSSLLLGILVLFVVHMFAEGYIFYGGSILCMSLWLVLGCATEYDPDEDEAEAEDVESFSIENEV